MLTAVAGSACIWLACLLADEEELHSVRPLGDRRSCGGKLRTRAFFLECQPVPLDVCVVFLPQWREKPEMVEPVTTMSARASS